MDCPLCNKEMKMLPGDTTYNLREENKEYDRTVYQCEADDAWVTTEFPKVSQE